MNSRLLPHDDFEAMIRIYSAAEGGRSTPPHNGVRWDFTYADDPDRTYYMIWPDFLDSHGDSLTSKAPLPVGVELHARMMIVMDERREEIHRARIAFGVRFYCHEGPRRVAEGIVTRITGLFRAR